MEANTLLWQCTRHCLSRTIRALAINLARSYYVYQDNRFPIEWKNTHTNYIHLSFGYCQ